VAVKHYHSRWLLLDTPVLPIVLFPVLAASSSGNNGAGGTSHSTAFPIGVAVGDLLILLFVRGSASTTTWPAGWNSLTSDTANNYALESRYRFYQAGDSAPTLTTSITTVSAYRMLRITGANLTTAPEATTLTVGTSTAPNPGSFDPAGWAAEDTLWIAVESDGGTAATTGYPAGYVNTTSAGNAFGGRISFGTRELNATSEDPGAFTLPASVAWSAATIAVRPVSPMAQQGHFLMFYP
jgi:hypothetical protein